MTPPLIERTVGAGRPGRGLPEGRAGLTRQVGAPDRGPARLCDEQARAARP